MVKKKVLVWETLATVSGGQKMTLTVMDMLADQYDFCCLIPKEGMLSEELEKRNIPYVLMGDQTLPTGVKGKSVIFRYGAMSVKNISKSIGVILRYKPDILYAPGPAALPWSAICGSLTHRPVIWHLHHIFLDVATKKLLNMCAKWKSVREIIAVSNCVGEQITDRSAHGKLKVLYNPVDVDKYSGGDSAKILAEVEAALGREIISETNNAKKTLVIGHIALIQRSKKQNFVLNVIHELRKQGVDAVGVFAGEIRERDYYEELQAQVSELSLSNGVAFLGRRNDIPDLLKMLDILMIPSAFEGFPLAGLEAASAGVPVAACNVAGAKEFVDVSGDGAVFEENDVDGAVEAIRKIMEGRKQMSLMGMEFARNKSLMSYCSSIETSFEAALTVNQME